VYRRHRFPPEVISYAVWLYFRFPLSLRMVEEMLAARGICVTYETVRQWGKKFGKIFADQIRQRARERRQVAYGWCVTNILPWAQSVPCCSVETSSLEHGIPHCGDR
jgi:transposase-like protein